MIILIGLPISAIIAVICFVRRRTLFGTGSPLIFQLSASIAALLLAFAIICPNILSSQYDDLKKEKDELTIEILTYDYNAVGNDVMKRKIERFNESYERYKRENQRLNILAVFQKDPEDLSFPSDYLENTLKDRKEKDKSASSEENKEERKKVEIDGKEYELVPIS